MPSRIAAFPKRVVNGCDNSTKVPYDPQQSEQRFIAIGMGTKARVLVVVYSYRGENIRIISARTAERREREEYEAQL